MKTQVFGATIKSRLLASGTLALGLFAGDGALGQSAPTPSTPKATLQEIVVTAERRESTVQRTAATLAVVNGATLQRQQVTQLTDLNSVLLDTQILPVVTSVQITIRGIGSNFVDPRADPAVATSVNGLFYDRSLPIGFGFLDVSRVEDLEGPQGTLYGRNAAAGALNIVTNQPTHQFGGLVRVSGGDLGENDVTGVLNLPATDDLAFRLAYDRDRRDGYLGGYYDDVHSDTGRASARWTPTDKLAIYAEANYVKIGGHGGGVSSWPCTGASAWSLQTPKSCAAAGPGGQIPDSGTIGSFVNSDQIHADYDFGWVKLTSISGYVGTHNRNDNVPEGTIFPQTIRTDSNDYSEELRFSGHDTAAHEGGLAWQAGAYLFVSTGAYSASNHPYGPGDPLYLGSPVISHALTKTQIYSKIPQSSQSGYAQATYGLTDHLRMTGGLRFSHDYKGLDYQQLGYATPVSAGITSVAAGHATASGDKWTYRGGLEYDLAPGKLIYANLSTGYVAGGVNGGDVNQPLLLNRTPAVFQPETITAYEIGSKSRFFGNRLQINGDFYHYDFHNFQYLYPSLLQGGGTVSNLQIQNAASVTAYGVELNGEFALTPDDRLSASVAWSHATFGKLSFAGVMGAVTPTTYTVAAGSAVPNDPDWTGLIGYEHTFRLKGGASVTLSANTKLSSKYLLVVGSANPYDTQAGYARTDASLAYHWPQDRYELRLWAKNLENAPVNIYGEGESFNLYGIEAPRTYGVTATANF